jgi:hypothetical protein
MRQETMTREERIACALRLEKPDRVPIVPCIPTEPTAYLAGSTPGQCYNNAEVGLRAGLKVFDDYGGWDANMGGAGGGLINQVSGTYPMKMRIPGKDLPDDYVIQVLEEPRLQLEDYDKICEMGWDQFYFTDFLWRFAEFTPQEAAAIGEEARLQSIKMNEELGKRGVRPWIGVSPFHPFFTLSLARSLVKFTEDLYYHPEIVERAISRMTDEMIPKLINITKQMQLNRCFFVDERASGFHYPLSIFERFWMPYTQKVVEAFWSEGITTIFHLDTCWDKNIAYFKKLPKGSYILTLDSTTDIFRAKEVLRGHGALSGDVSASLFALGTPAEVEAYVKRLIDEVGGDGGFILGVGCSAPPNIKPENFRAFIETGKTYELSK